MARLFVRSTPTSNRLRWRELISRILTLTHWGQDKMANIFQTTFSNAFSWMKMYNFSFRFHWRLFLRVQLTKYQHWFTYAIIWTNVGLVYWRICTSLGLNELTTFIKFDHRLFDIKLDRKTSLMTWTLNSTHNTTSLKSPFSFKAFQVWLYLVLLYTNWRADWIERVKIQCQRCLVYWYVYLLFVIDMMLVAITFYMM